VSKDAIQGYLRADGSVGVRNLIAVIPSCGCAQHAASRIASLVEGAALLNYTGGCGETHGDIALATDLLARYARHPNVIGTLVVSLGCETLDAHRLAELAAGGWAPVELLTIQELGGTTKTVAHGVEVARKMHVRAEGMHRVECPVGSLVIGLECGGSDATSGMAANPAMGAFSDLMVAQGARVILAETSELLGAEHIMVDRAANPAVANRLFETVQSCERWLKSTGEDFMGKQPSPGNVRGGITTVEEKALGDVLKGGHSPFVDTPGNDPASVTGLVAAGCQIVTFTTGRGNPMGNAVAPVVKITGNAHTWERMGSDIDLNASTIIGGAESVEQVGLRLYELVLRVSSGMPSIAETLGHDEFSMLRLGPVY
jgi:altronate dehydratase large subunit